MRPIGVPLSRLRRVILFVDHFLLILFVDLFLVNLDLFLVNLVGESPFFLSQARSVHFLSHIRTNSLIIQWSIPVSRWWTVPPGNASRLICGAQPKCCCRLPLLRIHEPHQHLVADISNSMQVLQGNCRKDHFSSSRI